MKVCKICGFEKELTDFYIYKHTGKHHKECKNCTKERSKKNREKDINKNKIMCKNWALNNKEYLIEYRKKYNEQHRERINNRQRKYNELNKEKRKEYDLKNKQKIDERDKKWKKENKERILKLANNYRKERSKVDEEFKLKLNMRRSFQSRVRKNNRKFSEFLGLEIKIYIEYFKNNYPEEFLQITEKNKIHIDHIIPCKVYDFSDEEEIKKCFNPLNLRLVDAKTNMAKHDKIDYELIKQHNIEHLLPKKIKEKQNAR